MKCVRPATGSGLTKRPILQSGGQKVLIETVACYKFATLAELKLILVVYSLTKLRLFSPFIVQLHTVRRRAL